MMKGKWYLPLIFPQITHASGHVFSDMKKWEKSRPAKSDYLISLVYEFRGDPEKSEQPGISAGDLKAMDEPDFLSL